MHTVLVDLGGVTDGATQQVVLLAEEAPPPGKGPEFGKASPVGLVVVLLLAVVTVLLIRSMSKRIRRLPASFDEPDGQQPVPDHRTGNAEDAEGGRA